MTFKTLQIVFLALLLGQLAFAIVGNMILDVENGIDTGALIYLVPAVMIVGSVAGYYIFNSNMAKAEAMEGSLEEKFKAFKTNSIVRWTMIEMGNLLAIVAAIIEGNSLYLIFFGVGLLVFSNTRPNIEEFAKRFNLSLEEQREFFNRR